MEISPVSAVRSIPTVGSRETEFGVPGVFEVEYSSRTGEESESPKNTKAASGAEEEEEEEEYEEEDAFEEAESGEEDDDERAPQIQTIEGHPEKDVNYFA